VNILIHKLSQNTSNREPGFIESSKPNEASSAYLIDPNGSPMKIEFFETSRVNSGTRIKSIAALTCLQERLRELRVRQRRRHTRRFSGLAGLFRPHQLGRVVECDHRERDGTALQTVHSEVV